MNFTILSRPRTQALLDGSVQPEGLSARWVAATDPLGWELPPQERHRDLARAELDGGEMSISSFIQARSRGAPLVALPIFLKRGLVQRSLFSAAGSPLVSPEQLTGRRVGLVNFNSSMAVWMRGVLEDGYGVDSSTVRWFSLNGASPHAQTLTIPDDFSDAGSQAWEELDGYPHQLDRRETFLFSLLCRGALDAVVSFQARIDCERSRPLLREESLWSHPLSTRLYPINHVFVVKTAALRRLPAAAESLSSALTEARRLWTRYQPQDKRAVFDRELARLGYDPFAYRLGDIEKATLETFIEFLLRERLISRGPGLDELIHGGS